MDNAFTIIGTVISGVIVFVVGEYFKEIWLEPLQEYKKLKQKVSFSLTFYANLYGNPIQYGIENTSYIKAGDELRILASELVGFIETISWFSLGIPEKDTIYEASKSLIGLSNNLTYKNNGDMFLIMQNNEKRENNIRNLLKIYTEKDDSKNKRKKY